MDELVIIGAGDHARVAVETARAAGWRVGLLLEPGTSPPPDSIEGISVVSDLSEASRADRHFIVAIGANRVRMRLFESVLRAGGRPATLVHPRAIVLEGSIIGDGSHICAGAVVGVAAVIGRNVIVNTAASVDHDDQVRDHAFIGPGCHLGGNVVVETGAHVGLGSSVIEGRNIGPWAYVAAGAVVTSDVPASRRVAGVPAKPMDDWHDDREGQ